MGAGFEKPDGVPSGADHHEDLNPAQARYGQDEAAINGRRRGNRRGSAASAAARRNPRSLPTRWRSASVSASRAAASSVSAATSAMLDERILRYILKQVDDHRPWRWMYSIIPG